MIPYDRDHPAARELQVIPFEKKKKKTTTCSQLNHFNVNEITPQCLCPCYVHLLVAGDVERHSTQHNFRPHAFNSSSYSQVQLTTEGEMRRGAQVCQRLQGLSRTQHIDSGKFVSFSHISVYRLKISPAGYYCLLTTCSFTLSAIKGSQQV